MSVIFMWRFCKTLGVCIREIGSKGKNFLCIYPRIYLVFVSYIFLGDWLRCGWQGDAGGGDCACGFCVL